MRVLNSPWAFPLSQFFQSSSVVFGSLSANSGGRGGGTEMPRGRAERSSLVDLESSSSLSFDFALSSPDLSSDLASFLESSSGGAKSPFPGFAFLSGPLSGASCERDDVPKLKSRRAACRTKDAGAHKPAPKSISRKAGRAVVRRRAWDAPVNDLVVDSSRQAVDRCTERSFTLRSTRGQREIGPPR